MRGEKQTNVVLLNKQAVCVPETKNMNTTRTNKALKKTVSNSHKHVNKLTRILSDSKQPRRESKQKHPNLV